MIKTLSSHQINNILNNANEKLKVVENELYNMKDVVSNRLNILQDEADWQTKCLNAQPTEQSIYRMIPLYDNKYGEFSSYYFDVLPSFVKEPINVFNIVSTQKAFFREDVRATLDDTVNVTDILKHDTLKSTYLYQRFLTNEVVLSIQLNDPAKPLGHSRFNIIEIDAFMPGSFSISSLLLYHGTEDPEEYTDFYMLGKNRILFNEKKQVNRIDIHFKLLFEKKEGEASYFPLAIKHIYLLDADLRTDSHFILKVEKNENISLIKNECIVSSNRGVESTTLKDLKAEVYAYYTDNQLYFPLTISTSNAIYEFPVSIDSIYIKLPITKAMSCLGIMIE